MTEGRIISSIQAESAAWTTIYHHISKAKTSEQRRRPHEGRKNNPTKQPTSTPKTAHTQRRQTTMPMICNGCRFSIQIGEDHYCNYLSIKKRSRLTICPPPGDKGPCLAREGGTPKRMATPRHKYDIKPSDIESVQKNKRKKEQQSGRQGGVPLSFDGDQARKLYEDDKLCGREVSEILGIKANTLKAWRLRHGIKVVRKRRTKAEIAMEEGAERA